MKWEKTAGGLVVPEAAKQKTRRVISRADFKVLRRAERILEQNKLGHLMYCRVCSGDDAGGEVTLEDRLKAFLKVDNVKKEIRCLCSKRVLV